MLNKTELVKILETISRDKKLDPDEAMKLTEHLLELFRQKPIIREVSYNRPHYPNETPIYPWFPWDEPRTGDPMPIKPTTFCCIVDISKDVPYFEAPNRTDQSLHD